MNALIKSLEGEYRRYKTLAERALEQVSDSQLSSSDSADSNSLAVVCWHVSGNLRSRFTDFLTTDGEKPWRHRDEEFENRSVSRAELIAKWEQGWAVLLDVMAGLSDEQLNQTVTIRGQELRVHEALHRSLAHTAYHVGQIVYLAKALRGEGWNSLSIPRGQSDAFTQRLNKPGDSSPGQSGTGREKH
jgi:uncharacterized damage-inducible protein DinB